MKPPVLRVLRDVVPIRPLTHGESLRIAELQAARFLELMNVTAPPVPESVITNLPKIEVRRMSPWPVSGCTDWAKGTWVIVLRGSDSLARQRFSLAHEFKHIVDHRFVDVIYPDLMYMKSHQRREVVCDYFAGCLLVPKSWLKQAWCNGMQSLPELASYFAVSQAAIQTRLFQTGLIDPEPRCLGSDRTGIYQRVGSSNLIGA